MSALPQELLDTETVLFRPSKKRKIYRQRASSTEPEPEPPTTASRPLPAPATTLDALSIDELIISSSSQSLLSTREENLEGTAVPISEILRLRKRNKRAGGVEFTSSASHTVRNEDGLVVRTKIETGKGREEGGLAVRKFAPQTGTVGDVNKHM
jgi:hypothetical protein